MISVIILLLILNTILLGSLPVQSLNVETDPHGSTGAPDVDSHNPIQPPASATENSTVEGKIFLLLYRQI